MLLGPMLAAVVLSAGPAEAPLATGAAATPTVTSTATPGAAGGAAIATPAPTSTSTSTSTATPTATSIRAPTATGSAAAVATAAPDAPPASAPTAAAAPTPAAQVSEPPTYVVPLTLHLERHGDGRTDGAASTGESIAPTPGADEAAALPGAPLGPPLADAGPVLLSRVARPSGHAIERLIEPSGEIVEHEVNAAGTVQSCRPVGRLAALRIVTQQPAAEGELVQVVRDASGALVQLVVGADGEPRAVALLAPAP